LVSSANQGGSIKPKKQDALAAVGYQVAGHKSHEAHYGTRSAVMLGLALSFLPANLGQSCSLNRRNAQLGRSGEI
jgi:hypothetical protein